MVKPVTTADLDEIIAETFASCKQLMVVKGGEYAHGADRLDNFRRNAAALGVEPETVWAVYAAKHWDSICTYHRDVQTGTTRVRSENMEGRFDDLINYLLLGKALLAAREEDKMSSDCVRDVVGRNQRK